MKVDLKPSTNKYSEEEVYASKYTLTNSTTLKSQHLYKTSFYLYSSLARRRPLNEYANKILVADTLLQKINFGDEKTPPKFVDCKDLHGNGCIERELNYVRQHVYTVLYMCLPYLVTGLVSHNVKLLNWIFFRKWIIELTERTLRTMCFVLGYGLWFGSVICLTRNIRHQDDGLNTFIAGLCSGTSIIFETPSRRLDIITYVTAKVIQIVYRLLYKRKLMISIPYGEIILFSTSMSIFMYLMETHPKEIKPVYIRTALKLFF